MRAAPLEDHDDQSRGLWGRFKERIGWGEYNDEEDVVYYDEPGDRRHQAALRVRPSRINQVSVWLSIQSFENAQMAADGLKDGNQQIVNLEKASPEVCTRVIDFLNGVTYALDGYVEKVGEKVYLFAPNNYCIDVENEKTGRRTQGPFHEN